MDRGGDIDGFVQRSRFDRDGVRLFLRFMPEPCAAGRAESAPETPAAVRTTGPVVRHSLGYSQAGTRHFKGYAECRGGLPLALAAMADVEGTRFARAFIPDLAALASAGPHSWASPDILRDRGELHRQYLLHYETDGPEPGSLLHRAMKLHGRTGRSQLRLRRRRLDPGCHGPDSCSWDCSIRQISAFQGSVGAMS